MNQKISGYDYRGAKYVWIIGLCILTPPIFLLLNLREWLPFGFVLIFLVSLNWEYFRFWRTLNCVHFIGDSLVLENQIKKEKIELRNITKITHNNAIRSPAEIHTEDGKRYFFYPIRSDFIEIVNSNPEGLRIKTY